VTTLELLGWLGLLGIAGLLLHVGLGKVRRWRQAQAEARAWAHLLAERALREARNRPPDWS
jgi:hypothetical protein